MLAGELYVSADDELVRERKRAKTLCRRYNEGDASPGSPLLEELLGYATDAYLEPPFFCDYGYNIELGSRVHHSPGRRDRCRHDHWRRERRHAEHPWKFRSGGQSLSSSAEGVNARAPRTRG